jgi:hypothetical protein
VYTAALVVSVARHTEQVVEKGKEVSVCSHPPLDLHTPVSLFLGMRGEENYQKQKENLAVTNEGRRKREVSSV